MSSSSHDGRDELPDEDDGWEIPTSDSDAGSVESSPDVPPWCLLVKVPREWHQIPQCNIHCFGGLRSWPDS